eukprot:2106444-Amphidinium_carterae.1
MNEIMTPAGLRQVRAPPAVVVPVGLGLRGSPGSACSATAGCSCGPGSSPIASATECSWCTVPGSSLH